MGNWALVWVSALILQSLSAYERGEPSQFCFSVGLGSSHESNMLSVSALACSQVALKCSETSRESENLLTVELCEGNIVLFLQESFAENKALKSFGKAL